MLTIETSFDRLVNAENGRLKKLDEILDRARFLLKNDAERVSVLRELKSMAMSQLIDRWKAMIGEDNDNQAAIMLGTTEVTLKRWRETGKSPRQTQLLRYEHVARKIEQKRRNKHRTD